jgi:hypothetical protein
MCEDGRSIDVNANQMHPGKWCRICNILAEMPCSALSEPWSRTCAGRALLPRADQKVGIGAQRGAYEGLEWL